MDFWTEVARPGPESVTVDGIELRVGARVRLRPRAGRDLLDLALAGQAARIEALEHDLESGVHVAVTLDADPGRDLGEGRYPGHRFFFAPDEVEAINGDGTRPEIPPVRILVAGIGNIFLGDDAFGVMAARELARHEWPAGVDVRDFGIRGLDLAYALQSGYDAAILVDAVPHGEAPGTLYVLEPALQPAPATIETHGMDPVKVLHLTRALGGEPPRTVVVGCEPRPLPADLDPADVVAEVSPEVQAAIAGAVSLVESLVSDLIAGTEPALLSNERR